MRMYPRRIWIEILQFGLVVILAMVAFGVLRHPH